MALGINVGARAIIATEKTALVRSIIVTACADNESAVDVTLGAVLRLIEYAADATTVIGNVEGISRKPGCFAWSRATAATSKYRASFGRRARLALGASA